MNMKNENKKTKSKKTNNENVDMSEPSTTNEPAQELPVAGFGDLVKKVTSALGIEQCEPCKKRQENFNRIWPWLKLKRDLTQEEIDMLARVNSSPIIKSDDVDMLFRSYNEIFQPKNKLTRCNCPGVISTMVGHFNNFNNV